MGKLVQPVIRLLESDLACFKDLTLLYLSHLFGLFIHFHLLDVSKGRSSRMLRLPLLCIYVYSQRLEGRLVRTHERHA